MKNRKFPCAVMLALVVVGISGCTKQARRARYLASADSDYAAGKLERAEIEYQRALQLGPQDAGVMGKLGILYFDQGRYPLAYAFLSKAVESAPDNADVRLKLALTELTLRQVKGARQDAEKVLQKVPGDPEALAVLAETALGTNGVRETVAQIEKLRQNDKDRVGYHLALGSLALRQGNAPQAETEYNQALQMDPKLPAVHTALAGLYWQRQDLVKADQAFQEALRLSPARSPRRLQYAQFKLGTGSTDEAKRIATEMTQQTPDFVPAWLFLAQVAAAENKADEASGYVQKALERDPVNLEGLLLSGNLLLRQGDGTNAAAQFERAIKVYGPQPRAEYNLALAQLATKQNARAMASLEQAIAVDTNYVDALLLQANLNLRQGNPGLAIASLTRLAAQQPAIPQPRLLLARAYAVQGRLTDALRTYRQVAQAFAKVPAVLFEVGNSLALLDRRDDAAAVYLQAADAFPTNAQVLFVAGRGLASIKHNAEARQAFEKALSVDASLMPAVEGVVDLDLAENQPAAAMARVQKEIDKNTKAAMPWLLLAKIHIVNAQEAVNKENTARPAGSKPLQIGDVPSVRGEADAAEQALLKAIDLDPNLPTSFNLLAKLYVSCNKQQQALDRLKSFVARTNDVPSLMQIALIEERVKDYPASRDAYERILKVNPNSGEALNNLAYLYAERLKDLDRAYELAQKAVRLMPNDPATADTLGWVLYHRGDYVRAADQIEQAATRLSNQPELEFHLGMVNYMLGQEDVARPALENALKSSEDFPGKEEAKPFLALLAIDPKTAGPEQVAALQQRLKAAPTDLIALSRLGAIQERDGHMDEAIETYQTELRSSPQNAQVMFKLAQLYGRNPNASDKALDFAKQAHAAAPDDPRISALMGRLVFRSGDFNWAASLLEDSARKLPGDPGVAYDLAWADYSLGRVADAQAAMQNAMQAGLSGDKAQDAKVFGTLVAAGQSAAPDAAALGLAEDSLKRDPVYVPALMVSAGALARDSKYKESATLYEKVLGRFGSFTPAMRELAILSFDRLNDDQRAYDLATKARESSPNDADVARVLGIISYRRGDYSRAAQFLGQCGRQRQSDPEVFYYLGMAHYQLKSKTASKAALQRALALNLDAKQADEAKRVLIELK